MVAQLEFLRRLIGQKITGPPEPEDVLIRLLQWAEAPNIFLRTVLAVLAVLGWWGLFRNAFRRAKKARHVAPKVVRWLVHLWQTPRHAGGRACRIVIAILALAVSLGFAAAADQFFVGLKIDSSTSATSTSASNFVKDSNAIHRLATLKQVALSPTALQSREIGSSLELPWWAGAHLSLCVLALLALMSNRNFRRKVTPLGATLLLCLPAAATLAIAAVFGLMAVLIGVLMAIVGLVTLIFLGADETGRIFTSSFDGDSGAAWGWVLTIIVLGLFGYAQVRFTLLAFQMWFSLTKPRSFVAPASTASLKRLTELTEPRRRRGRWSRP